MMGLTWIAFTVAGFIIGANVGFFAHCLWINRRMRTIELTGFVFIGAAAIYQDDLLLRGAAQAFASALGNGDWQDLPSTEWTK